MDHFTSAFHEELVLSTGWNDTLTCYPGLDPARASTGVVWCTERAYEYGLLEDPSKWANLGQGAPEVDDGMLIGLEPLE